jgi:hypothetical protein
MIKGPKLRLKGILSRMTRKSLRELIYSISHFCLPCSLFALAHLRQSNIWSYKHVFTRFKFSLTNKRSQSNSSKKTTWKAKIWHTVYYIQHISFISTTRRYSHFRGYEDINNFFFQKCEARRRSKSRHNLNRFPIS